MADAIRIRIENWLTANGGAVLRRTIAPAITVTASTVWPIELPSWRMSGHVINVRAIRGSAFVEIGASADPADYDPPGRGRLLLEGEQERFLVWPESFVIIQQWNVEL